MNTYPVSESIQEHASDSLKNQALDSTGAPTVQAANLSSADVTAALNAILTVDKFAASPQMSAFLRYVVEQTLLGNSRRIKAFTVGLEALGKSSSFDPQTDPSVRVLAKRLRSSLETYYKQHPDTPVIIEMKPGSYIPKFLLREQLEPQQPATLSDGTVAAQHELTNAVPSQVALIDNNPNHVSINQSTNRANEVSGTNADKSSSTSPQADTADKRISGIQRLWKAYKSTPKVAVVIATLGASGWLGVGSYTPELIAKATYQDNNPAAEMRLELVGRKA